MKARLSTVSLLLVSVCLARATLFTYEPFNGTNGQSLATLPQITLSGSGSDPLIGAATLSYSNVAAGTGLSAAFSGATKIASINYTSLSNPDPNIYNNTYVSFMLKADDISSLSATGSKVLWLSSGSTSVASFWIRKSGSFYNVGVSRNESSIQWNPTTFNTADSMFMVMAYAWEAPFGRPAGIHGWMMPPQDELLDLYRNEDEGPKTGAAFLVFDTPNSLFPDNISLAGAAGSSINIDEIRIGTKWLDVAPIPEPSSAALLLVGLGLSAIAMRRFRR